MKEKNIITDAHAFVNGIDADEIPNSAELTEQEIADIIDAANKVAAVSLPTVKNEVMLDTIARNAYAAGYMRGRQAGRGAK